MTILLIYWILTTIYGTYWLVKHPSSRHGDDDDEFTLLEVIAKMVPAALIAWGNCPNVIITPN